MKNCNLCGERLMQTEDAYKLHCTRFHPTKIDTSLRGLDKVFKREIKPERITNRSKAEIVFDMEKTWGVAVIPAIKPWQTINDAKGAI